MLIVHCVIQREYLVAKDVAPKLREILSSVIECISSTIKANAKVERLFQRFREANHPDHGQWRN